MKVLNLFVLTYVGCIFFGLLHITCNSSNSPEKSKQQTVAQKETQPVPELSFGSVSDVEGNFYKTIQIGTQVWMAENLRTTKYNNGTPIPNVMDSVKWGKLNTGAWCYYNNDAANNNLYGKLYNWYAVINSNQLCPKGWHVPSDAEWTILMKYLDPTADETLCCNNKAGEKMKTTGEQYWKMSNKKVTNSSGFSGMPGGARNLDANSFNYLGQTGYWWSTTETNIKTIYGRFLYFLNNALTKYSGEKTDGFCVRCLQD